MVLILSGTSEKKFIWNTSTGWTSSEDLTIVNSKNLTVGTGGSTTINSTNITLGNSITDINKIELNSALLDINVGTNGINMEASGASNLVTNSGAALTLTSASAITWSTTAGKLTLDGYDGIDITSSNSGNVSMNSTNNIQIDVANNSKDILIGNTSEQTEIILGNNKTSQIKLNSILLDINAGTGGIQMDSDSDINITTSSTNKTYIANSTDSTSTTTGSLVINGGVGIRHNLNVGSLINKSVSGLLAEYNVEVFYLIISASKIKIIQMENL